MIERWHAPQGPPRERRRPSREMTLEELSEQARPVVALSLFGGVDVHHTSPDDDRRDRELPPVPGAPTVGP